MVKIVITFVLAFSLLVTVSLAVYTLFRCESKKSRAFIYLLTCVFLYVLGYLLEINARTSDGGFVAIKVMYLGSAFLASIDLLFTAEYCDIAVSRKVLVVLIGIPLFIICLVWTSDLHGLYYSSYEYVADALVPYLSITPGPLYYITHINATVLSIIMISILLARIIRGKPEMRPLYVLFLAGALVPTLVNILYVANLNASGLNYTPISMIVKIVLFFVCIVRYNMFSFIPQALEMALQSISEAFVLVDASNMFLTANETAIKIFPSLAVLKQGAPIAQAQSWPAELIPPLNEKSVIKTRFSLPDDMYYNASISAIVGEKDRVLGHFILVQDITESVLLTKRLEELAHTDMLTGIPNRRHFMSLTAAQIDRVKRHNENSYIVMFDIDHFKKVNDTYGHPVGDKVLKCLAERVSEAIRAYDILGRYGGEEFILFVSGISERDIGKHMDRVRRVISGTPMVFGDLQLTITASFGVVSVLDCPDLETMIENADQALYAAKQRGRDRVVYYDSLIESS